MTNPIFGDDLDSTSCEACLQFPCQQAWKLSSTTLFVLDCCFWGNKGVPPHQRRPQIPWITVTGTPNLDPFFLPLLLTITFDQTAIKHSFYM